MRRGVAFATLAVLLLLSVLVPAAHPGLILRIVVSVGPPAAACAVAFLFLARPFPSRNSAIAECLILGYGGSAVAHLVYQVLWQKNGSPVFPSVADALFVVAYVFLIAGFALLAGTGDRTAVLDASIVVAGGGVVVASVLIRPQLLGVDFASQSLTVVYPLLDCLLLMLALQGLFARTLKGAGSAALLGGFLAMLVGDTAVLRAVNVPPAWLGVPFSVSFCLLATGHLASLHRVDQAPSLSREERRGEDSSPAGGARLVLLPIASCLPSAALVLEGALRGVTDWPILGTGSVVIALATALRLRKALSVMRQQSARLTRLATIDELTGLLNRRQFTTTAVRLQGLGHPFAVGLLDLDHFKRVNDELGHAVGDQLLRATAEAWTRCLPPGAQLFRWGGEEFVVLLIVEDSEWGAGEAFRHLDRMRLATPRPYSVSAGLVRIRSTESVDDVLSRADEQLYKAKRTRNTVCVDPA